MANYRMKTVVDYLSEKRKTTGIRIKLVLQCGHIVVPTYTVNGIVYGKTKVRCYECATNEIDSILRAGNND